MENQIKALLESSNNRLEFWVGLVNQLGSSSVAEIGVYKGEFAETILSACRGVERYTMIDPWRNLDDWNKPANKDNDTFEAFYKETMEHTDFAKEKRTVLRGKTTEVINQILDNSIDFAYVDGDHTLKGITIDLVNIWPKISETGVIAGDDFAANIWQHSKNFEPTLVFPFAVYFAEAMNTTIYGLPHSQFLMTKECRGFKFVDLTNHGAYAKTDLLHQLNHQAGLKTKLGQKLPGLRKVYRKLR